MRSRLNVFLWTGSLLLTLAAFSGVTEAQKSASYKRGVDLFNQGSYSEALKAFDQALKETPLDSETYRQRARCRDRLEDLKGALADYDKAIELQPANVPALTARSALRRRLKDVAGAVDDINRAIELDPKNAGAYNNRGLLRWDARDYKGALADYDYSVGLNPRQSPVFNNRGLVKEKLNDFEGALADYTKAIENNPKNADAYSNRAFCRKTLGDTETARLDYQSALAIDPGHKFATAQLKKLEVENPGGATRRTAGGDQAKTGTPAGTSDLPRATTPKTSAAVPVVQFQAGDPCQAAKKPAGLPWQTPKRARPPPLPPGSRPRRCRHSSTSTRCPRSNTTARFRSPWRRCDCSTGRCRPKTRRSSKPPGRPCSTIRRRLRSTT